MIKPDTYICAECGGNYRARRKTSRFCSPNCKIISYRKSQVQEKIPHCSSCTCYTENNVTTSTSNPVVEELRTLIAPKRITYDDIVNQVEAEKKEFDPTLPKYEDDSQEYKRGR